jgi:hypothetical protein
VKLPLTILMTCALAAPPAAFAFAADSKDKAEKSAKSDKSEKAEKADKSDKDKSDKAEKDKADKADKNAKADDGTAEKAAETPADPNAPAAATAAPVADAAATAAAAAAAAAQDKRDDSELDLAQPDFTVINLPTTLRMPKYKSAFRVTHRFARSLGEGSFGELAEDLFGLDASAQIGLEYRFGIFDGAQIGVFRTNADRTIQLFAQYDLKQQSKTFPVSIAVYGSIEGTDNLKDRHQPAISAVIGRSFNKHAAVYAMPGWVNNTSDLPSELVDDNSTVVLGLGGRFRVHGGTYVVLEVFPRVAGYKPEATPVAFGFEKRVGGHAFQMNFSNYLGSTMGAMARGAQRDGNGKQSWYMGFNLSRKFF